MTRLILFAFVLTGSPALLLGQTSQDTQSQEQSDQDLTAILEYETGIQESGRGSDDLTAKINPFPERRQGRFYGTLYEFHRNDNLDARNFFDPVGEPLPEFKRNQFGVTLGTDLSDTLTVQGAYDGLRIIQGSTILSHVPTGAMKSGDLSSLGNTLIDPLTGQPFPGNQIPAERISPIAKRLLAVIPSPNASDPDRNFINSAPSIENQDRISGRLDYEPDDHSKLFFHYVFEDGLRRFVSPIPTFSATNNRRHQSFQVVYDRSFTPSLVAGSRLTLTRSTNLTLSDNAGRSGLLESIGIQGVTATDPLEEGFPTVNLTGYVDLGNRRSPSTQIENGLEWGGSLTYARSGHRLTSGFEVTYEQLNALRSSSLSRGRFDFSGTFTGDAFADFLLGLPDTAARAVGTNRADLRRLRLFFFFRDQWRLRPELELSLGVRYSYLPPPFSNRNNVSTFFPLLFEPPTDGGIVVAGTEEASRLGLDDTIDGTLTFPDRNNWAPQVAVAYSPWGDNGLVLRASYSIFHRPIRGRLEFADFLSRNPPFYQVQNVETETNSPTIDFTSPFTGAVAPELTIRGISPHLRNSYFQNWSLRLTNQWRDWTLAAEYEGRRGVRTLRVLPANVPLPGPGLIDSRRPNPQFGQFQILTSSGSSSSHRLELEAERRLAGGISVRSEFGWDREIDDDYEGRPSNPRNLKAEKGPNDWNRSLNFELAYIYDLPFGRERTFPLPYDWLDWIVGGWRLSGITEWSSGRFLTVWVPGDPNNDGLGGDRPNLTGDPSLESGQSIDAWFDTSVFAAPPPFGFGNAGRGIVQGPAEQTWDISLIKSVPIRDGELLQFRVELFNAFNHVNFDDPNSAFGTSVFGKIFGAGRAREIELALKYSF